MLQWASCSLTLSVSAIEGLLSFHRRRTRKRVDKNKRSLHRLRPLHREENHRSPRRENLGRIRWARQGDDICCGIAYGMKSDTQRPARYSGVPGEMLMFRARAEISSSDFVECALNAAATTE